MPQQGAPIDSDPPTKPDRTGPDEADRKAAAHPNETPHEDMAPAGPEEVAARPGSGATAVTEAPNGRPSRHAVRRALAAILVALTVLGVVATTAAFWLHERLLDANTYVAAIRPALEDRAVTDAIGDYVSDQIFEAVDLEGRFDESLTAADDFLAAQLQGVLGLGDVATRALGRLDPPKLADLAGPLAAAVQSPVRNAVNDFVASPGFRNRLEEAIVVAHADVVALLRAEYEKLPNVAVESGEVRLDLVPLIAATLREVIERGLDFLGLDAVIPVIPVADTPGAGIARLAEALGTDLPPDYGQVVVMSEARLSQLQGAMRTFDRFPWLLLIVTLVFIGSAIAVSTRRRRTVVQVAIGTAAGLFIGEIGLRRLEQAVVDAVGDPEGRAAVKAVVASTLGSLRATLVVLTIVAALLGVILILSERGLLQAAWRWVRNVTYPQAGGSRAQRFAADYADPLRAAGWAAAAVVLFFTGIGWPQVIVIGGLLGLYLWGIAASGRTVTADAEERPLGVDAPG